MVIIISVSLVCRESIQSKMGETLKIDFRYVRLCHLDIPREKWRKLFANSGDPESDAKVVPSDLRLHCLPLTLLGVSRLTYVKDQISQYINSRTPIICVNVCVCVCVCGWVWVGVGGWVCVVLFSSF